MEGLGLLPSDPFPPGPTAVSGAHSPGHLPELREAAGEALGEVRQQGADQPPRTTNQALPGPAQARPLTPIRAYLIHSFLSHSGFLKASQTLGPCHPQVSLLSPSRSQTLGRGPLQSVLLTPPSYPWRQTPLSPLFCRWGNRLWVAKQGAELGFEL